MSINTYSEIFKAGLDSIKKTVGNNIRNKRSVFLGNVSSATQEIFVDSNETSVYVHGQGNDTGSVEIITASGIPKNKLIFKQPLELMQIANGDWVFARVDSQADTQFSAGVGTIPDLTPVTISQLDYGTLQLYVGLQVLVKSAIYGNDMVGDILTGDFATGTVQDTSATNIVVPTTNNKSIAILIQVTPSSATLSYKQSAEFNATVSLTQAYIADLLPLPDADSYRVGYLKLTKGIVTFTPAHLLVVPEFLSKSDTAFPVTLNADKTIYANTQIVIDELTIASGVTLTIESTAILMVI